MTVILEPDALGLIGARRSCLKRSKVASRLALLAYAAQRLGTTPGSTCTSMPAPRPG